jgi:hypothetical protein
MPLPRRRVKQGAESRRRAAGRREREDGGERTWKRYRLLTAGLKDACPS